jgi:dihydrofolate reductase
LDVEGDAAVCSDLSAGLSFLASYPTHPHRYFIIGGSSLYSETLALPNTAPAYVDRVLLTRVLSPAFEDCDVFVPELDSMTAGEEAAGEAWIRSSHAELCEWAGFEVPSGVQEEKGIKYEFQMWIRRS